MHRIRPALLLIAILAVAGCSKPPAACVGSGPLNPFLESATYAAALKVDLGCSTRTATGLYYRDLVAGTGTTAAAGMSVSVKYSGTLADGTPFDAGTYPFRLGAREVVPGWDEGVAGMKVGGSRQLILPPDLGYGAGGRPPVIPPNSIMVFTVELLAAQ